MSITNRMQTCIVAAVLMAASTAFAATHGSVAVSFDSPQWQVNDANARHEQFLGRNSLYLTSGFAFLKDVPFEDGVIDVDMAMTSLNSFVGVTFRGQSADDYEIVYFRPFKSGQPDAVQYTPAFNGSAAWQLYSGKGYTAAVPIPHDQWVHVRIEVRGLSVRVYFNDSEAPVLVNDDLKHGYSRGSIGLWGIANGGHFSNFRYTTTQAGEKPAVRPAPSAPGIIAKWELSESFAAAQRDPESLPSAAALKAMTWQAVGVEVPGMVVIDRYRRGPDLLPPFADPQTRVGARPQRGVVFARTTINSDRDQVTRMSFGYSDEATVFLNGRPLFTGRSAYRYRDPGFLGIMDVENDSVYLHLKKGRNELLLAVAEYFGGWGFISRIDDMRGIKFD
ncbi:MAG TPA: family 16 glycoside hydrolase [Thermoanaerobaculia bacterium]|nr:family 16 glycoside hydrolase [Thermoanaerobaculia bacterium]